MNRNQVQRKLKAFVGEVQAKVEELLGSKKKAVKRRSKSVTRKKTHVAPVARKNPRKVRTVERRIETSQ